MKFLEKIIWFVFVIAIVILRGNVVFATETESAPMLELNGNPISISENTSFYFLPSESRGYGLHMVSDIDGDECKGVGISVYYYDTEWQAWIEDTYEVCYEQYDEELEKNIFDVEYGCYLKKDVEYRIDIDIFGDDSRDIQLTLTESDAAGMYQNMLYRVDNDVNSGKYITITAYEGEDKEITIPGVINGYPVESIGDNAFAGCESIEKLCVSENIAYFGDWSFSGCSNLKIVELPSTFLYPGQNPFKGCPIESITFPNGSEYGKFENHSLIIRNTLIGYYGGDAEEYVIPDGVEEIAMGCFPDCNIQGMYIPESVYYIGSAFYSLSSLEKCYIANPSCRIQLAEEEGDWGSFYSEWDEENNKAFYNVTIYAKSNGLLEGLCKDGGIAFASTGQMEQYTEIKEGEFARGGIYKDGKIYYSFCPEEDGTYLLDIGEPSYTISSSVCDEAGNDIAMEDGAYFYDAYMLQAGKQYYITMIYKYGITYAGSGLCVTKAGKNADGFLDIENSSISAKTATPGDTITWSFKIKEGYQAIDAYCNLEFPNGSTGRNTVIRINEDYVDVSYTVPESGQNGTYHINSLGICIGDEAEWLDTSDYAYDFSSLDVVIGGMQEDDTPPDVDFDKIKVSIDDNKLKIYIPVKDDLSGVDEIGVEFLIFNKDRNEWEELPFSYGWSFSINPGAGTILQDGYMVEQAFDKFMRDVESTLGHRVASTDIFAINRIGIWDAAGNVAEGIDYIEDEVTGIDRLPSYLRFTMDKTEPNPEEGESSDPKPGTSDKDSGTTQPEDSTTLTPKEEQDNQSVLPTTGTTIKISTGTYKVTKSTETGKEVAFIKPKSSKKSAITIPDTIKISGFTYKVTSVAANALANNKKVTKVTVGKNVTSIGKNAFKKCTKLKTVTLKSTSLKSIGSNAFYGDKNLKTITIKSSKLTSKSVGKNAFKGTNKKLTIKVPKKKVSSYKKFLKKKGNKNVTVKK